jgi:hypothetical protein
MKKITLLICFILSSAICKEIYAQDAATLKAMQDFMTPGDIHKMLAKFDGKWKSDNNMWMAPGAPPIQMQMEVENKMILGGRYQQSIQKGSMMGMPFEGISTLGWDNGKKVFVSTWIDNMGTGIIYMEGTWDATTNTVELKGKQTDPATGKQTDIRETFQIMDDNTEAIQIFSPGPDGKEFKFMEAKLTRIK